MPRVPREEGIAVRSFCCFHGGGAGGNLLKDGCSAVFVPDIIALVNDAAFELASRIIFRKLVVLFDADFEIVSEMRLLTGGFDTGLDDLGRFHGQFVPAATAPRGPEAVPFLFHGSLGRWLAAPLGHIDVAGDTSHARRGTVRTFVTVGLPANWFDRHGRGGIGFVDTDS